MKPAAEDNVSIVRGERAKYMLVGDYDLPMSVKFIKKYMRLAKMVAEDQNPCLSRAIGAVVVDPCTNRVLSMGYNGPPRGTPHPDDPEYLREIVWPQLTEQERGHAGVDTLKEFLDKFGHSGVCPRKAVGCKSGERLELCSCEHAEKNAIANSGNNSLDGAYMFCWCGVPCWDCTKLIINAGIIHVVCFDWGADYSHGSRWLFEKAGVELTILNKEWVLAP